MSLEIINNRSSTLNLSVPYYVEQYIEGSWYQIPFENNHDFIMTGIILEPNESYTQNISIKQFDLSSGKYRVVKPISEKLILAEEFEIE
ncbi:immunoglobulin-like domain-containing protein [Gracilibacillus sp. D59]|uniref:immunoglobulin-like domain-containing protein n=1 Tax=Gracilibacillus sp. D59 TaxID=3457434 RepID=UPI003FCDF153